MTIEGIKGPISDSLVVLGFTNQTTKYYFVCPFKKPLEEPFER